MITHKYVPFKPNVHEKYRVKGHRFLCYQTPPTLLNATPLSLPILMTLM